MDRPLVGIVSECLMAAVYELHLGMPPTSAKVAFDHVDGCKRCKPLLVLCIMQFDPVLVYAEPPSY